MPASSRLADSERDTIVGHEADLSHNLAGLGVETTLGCMLTQATEVSGLFQ